MLPCLLCRSSPYREASPRAATQQRAAVPRNRCQSSEGASSLATLRLRGTRTARAANLRFRHLLNFGQDQCRFVLEGSLHRVVIAFGIFSGAKLKAQVSQIVVDGVAPLHQLV